jgi:hypothetical protein
MFTAAPAVPGGPFRVPSTGQRPTRAPDEEEALLKHTRLGRTGLRVSRICLAVAALDLELSPDEIAALEAPYAPRPVAGFA